MTHHHYNDLPNWLKEATAAIIPTTFWDEDSYDPPELDGYLAFIPDGLDEPNEHVPSVPCAHIIWPCPLWILL